ncbi:MAG TPA: winged helix-turn-helix domain-containing protein [Steroidobacteraceae bacterium]|nr:winged helix-turn-helix domain-containing protein [Steroidobacteraceae bacterium]
MSLTPQELQSGFRIGEYLVEPRQNRIVRGGSEVRLEPRVMDVLVCLAAGAGEVVSRDTLNATVWRDVVVTDQAVTNCISELRDHLGDDRSTNRVIETIPKRGYRLVAPVKRSEPPAPASPVVPPKRSLRWPVGIVALVLMAVAGVAWWRTRAATPTLTSVAVVKFTNAANDASLEYLALALPDEIATLLTQSRDLAVRPIAYVDAEDPIAAARGKHVEHIVTGRYYLEDDKQLSLAVEAQRVDQERVIWRTRVTVPAGDLLAMRGRIADAVEHGLLPALGARASSTPGMTPAHDEAYQLYLRAIALPQQPKLTEKAIEMLQRAVTLDPKYAPAWDELGLRYYASGTWFTGAEEARQKSLAAHRKALELDPELISAARQIVTYRAEGGDLQGALDDARRFFEHFGPGAETHFALAYVYRYGGLLEEAQRHCELALDHDPQDPRLRSCGYAYLYGGNLARVMDFFKLDEGSYFAEWATVLYQLRRKDDAAALAVVLKAADEPITRLMQPCLEGVRGTALDAVVADYVKHWERSDDPETQYALAAPLAYCGRPHEALQLLERGVDAGYCSFPALDLDPLWHDMGGDPEFQRIRTKAMACHERFRRAVAADVAT